MILYTILNPDEVLGNPMASSQQEYRPLPYGMVELERGQDGFRVRRVISTDLRDYLNPDLSPGRSLSDSEFPSSR